jgi:hypothetical protein
MGDFDRDEDQVGEVPEHRLTPPEHHRDDIDDELVERARPQGLAHGRGATGDVDHAIPCRLARLLKGGTEAAGDEEEGRTPAISTASRS